MITVPLGVQAALPDIAAIRQALADALAGGDDEIVVDAGALADADFSLIQVLEAARRQARADGRTLRLAPPANAVLTGLLARAGVAPTAPDDLDFWSHGASHA